MFDRAKQFFNEAKDELVECSSAIHQIALQMQAVHARDYKGEVDAKIAWFQASMWHLEQRLSLSSSTENKPKEIQYPKTQPVTTITRSTIQDTKNLSEEQRINQALCFAQRITSEYFVNSETSDHATSTSKNLSSVGLYAVSRDNVGSNVEHTMENRNLYNKPEW